MYARCMLNKPHFIPGDNLRIAVMLPKILQKNSSMHSVLKIPMGILLHRQMVGRWRGTRRGPRGGPSGSGPGGHWCGVSDAPLQPPPGDVAMKSTEVILMLVAVAMITSGSLSKFTLC